LGLAQFYSTGPSPPGQPAHRPFPSPCIALPRWLGRRPHLVATLSTSTTTVRLTPRSLATCSTLSTATLISAFASRRNQVSPLAPRSHPALLFCLAPPLCCCSRAMSRTAAPATGAAAHAAPASPPRAEPWHQATGHQAIPARSRRSRADIVRPDRESTAPSTPHLRPFPGPTTATKTSASTSCTSSTTSLATATNRPTTHQCCPPSNRRRRRKSYPSEHPTPLAPQINSPRRPIALATAPHHLVDGRRRIWPVPLSATVGSKLPYFL
jgi:hypothetical protein